MVENIVRLHPFLLISCSRVEEIVKRADGRARLLDDPDEEFTEG